MIKKNSIFWKRIAFITLLAIPSIFGVSQDCPTCLPFMYIKNKETRKRIKSFEKEKQPVLTQIIQQVAGQQGQTHPENYDYPVSTLDSLIHQLQIDNPSPPLQGLIVYFGAYSSDASCIGIPMRGILTYQIVLIFAPATLSGKYYVPIPNSKHYVIGTDYNPHSISSSCETAWIDNYEKFVDYDGAGGLVTTINKNAPENHLGGVVTNAATDTRSISYKWNNFVDFIQGERRTQNCYQSSKADSIDGIRIQFAAYTSKGVRKNDPNCTAMGTYVNRLHIIFNFKRGNDVYKIKKKRRKHQTTKCNGSSEFIKTGDGGDNGQLCPLNCPGS